MKTAPANIRVRARRAKSFVLVAALSLTAAGCIQGTRREPPPPEPGSVTATPKGLKFSVSVVPARFTVGQKVALEASMFNETEKAFERKCPTSCIWDYDVTTADGRSVGPARECTPEGSELRLEPGELRMIMRNWGGRDHYFGAVDVLPPGTYLLTAGFVDEFGRVIPMMEPVEVEVLARR